MVDLGPCRLARAPEFVSMMSLTGGDAALAPQVVGTDLGGLGVFRRPQMYFGRNPIEF